MAKSTLFMLTKITRPLFTDKYGGILPLQKRDILCTNDRISLQFGRRFGSITAEKIANYQSYRKL